MKTHDLINLLKDDPEAFTDLELHGKQLSDFDPTKLKVEVMPCGFSSLDDYKLLKRGRGELILIGARPSQGKSGLGFQLATGVAKYSKVHLFSLEMDHESIVGRQAAIAMNRPLDYIQSGRAHITELNSVKHTLAQLNCVVDDRSSLNIYQICDAARQQHKRSPTSLILVDYIQIVATDGKNPVQELGMVSSELKNLAKELRVPVIALSQLNRQSEFRDGGEPQLSDLKGAGQLEQDADMVLLIHREKDAPTTAKIHIVKNRNGPTGMVEMEFAPAQCRFIDRPQSVKSTKTVTNPLD